MSDEELSAYQERVKQHARDYETAFINEVERRLKYYAELTKELAER